MQIDFMSRTLLTWGSGLDEWSTKFNLHVPLKGLCFQSALALPIDGHLPSKQGRREPTTGPGTNWWTFCRPSHTKTQRRRDIAFALEWPLPMLSKILCHRRAFKSYKYSRTNHILPPDSICLCLRIAFPFIFTSHQRAFAFKVSSFAIEELLPSKGLCLQCARFLRGNTSNHFVKCSIITRQ